MSAATAWATLCHHCDGIATGTLHEALHQLGAFDRMARFGFRPEDLTQSFGIRSGYAALTVKLLVSQGLARLDGDRFALTPDGVWVAEHPEWSRGARDRVGVAQRFLHDQADGSDDPWLQALADLSTPARFTQQRLGPLCAALWYHLDDIGALAEPVRSIDEDKAAPGMCAVLEQAGWLHERQLTEDGRQAAAFVKQFAYPLAYLPTFYAVARLLTEGAVAAPPGTGAEEETVDRALDISFSGQVFSNACRTPVLAALLPIFDRPLSEQPAALVDTGSGDGTMLADVFEAIRTNTRRGAALDRHPLTLVGVEYNEVARRATEIRLADLDTPSLAIFGDIGAPQDISSHLTQKGIDAADALHINKSVLHNRQHRTPHRRWQSPGTKAVFCQLDGNRISANEAFGALVELLQAWKPLIARHGMICIEAHTVDPVRAAGHIGRSLITGLDAAHGFSGQFLMEIGMHRAAVAAAGLHSPSMVDLGEAMMGEPIMSVDHLVLEPT